MRWFTWSFIPGLHWLAWIQAGLQARMPAYCLIGLIYALPALPIGVLRLASFRILLLSWAISLAHAYLRRAEIDQRIASGPPPDEPPDEPDESLRQALLKAAMTHGGRLSVTQGVLATGSTFTEVEQTLNDMVVSGYVFTRHNPHTEVVEYVFTELI